MTPPVFELVPGDVVALRGLLGEDAKGLRRAVSWMRDRPVELRVAMAALRFHRDGHEPSPGTDSAVQVLPYAPCPIWPALAALAERGSAEAHRALADHLDEAGRAELAGLGGPWWSCTQAGGTSITVPPRAVDPSIVRLHEATMTLRRDHEQPGKARPAIAAVLDALDDPGVAFVRDQLEEDALEFVKLRGARDPDLDLAHDGAWFVELDLLAALTPHLRGTADHLRPSWIERVAPLHEPLLPHVEAPAR